MVTPQEFGIYEYRSFASQSWWYVAITLPSGLRVHTTKARTELDAINKAKIWMLKNPDSPFGLYLVRQELYPGNWTDKFCFESPTPEDAKRAAAGWARYHSLNQETVIIEEIDQDSPDYDQRYQHWLHNEYVWH